MKSRRTSAIWKPSKERFIEILKDCSTIEEVLNYFGMNNKGGNFRTLKARMFEEGIDFKNLKKPYAYASNRNKKSLGDILVIGSKIKSNSLKRKVVDGELFEDKCYECGVENTWNEKPLTITLHHINGINTDNRIENITLLCPNCHSQTHNFAGRSLKRNQNRNNCICCGVSISIKSLRCRKCVRDNANKRMVKFHRERINEKTEFKCECGSFVTKKDVDCRACSRIKTRKIERPPKEDLEKLVWEKPTTKIAQDFGVSDKAIDKWCKSYGISKPPRGYWAKKQSEDKLKQGV